jgi:cystathionine gamma-synthase/cystathionine gamma-lyase/cystathionine beta-lyase
MSAADEAPADAPNGVHCENSARLSMSTIAVHAGERRVDGAVVAPIFQSATFVESESASGAYHSVRYTRCNNNPSQLVCVVCCVCADAAGWRSSHNENYLTPLPPLEKKNQKTKHTQQQKKFVADKIAALEGAEAALVLGSGMAAIASTLLTLLRAGDHLLVPRAPYGGTHTLVTVDLPALGIEASAIDVRAPPETWAAALRGTTRVIYVEALSNPLVEVTPLRDVVAFARAHGLKAVIDATFATPLLVRPLALGFDAVVHSCTKALNGHSDVIAGVVAGAAELVERVRHKANHLGGTLDPHAAFLLQRGLKTLALRVRAQNTNALALAEMLARHEAVVAVLYVSTLSVSSLSLSASVLCAAAKGARGRVFVSCALLFCGLLPFGMHTYTHTQTPPTITPTRTRFSNASLGCPRTRATRPPRSCSTAARTAMAACSRLTSPAASRRPRRCCASCASRPSRRA